MGHAVLWGSVTVPPETWPRMVRWSHHWHPFWRPQRCLPSCGLSGAKVPKVHFPWHLCLVFWLPFVFGFFQTGFPWDGFKVAILLPRALGVLGFQVCTTRLGWGFLSLHICVAYTFELPLFCLFTTMSHLPDGGWITSLSPSWAFQKLIIFPPDLLYASCTLKLHHLTQYHPSQTTTSVKRVVILWK